MNGDRMKPPAWFSAVSFSAAVLCALLLFTPGRAAAQASVPGNG